MKHRIKFLLIGVVLMGVFSLSACISQQAENLQKKLYEKYNTEFVVKEIGGGEIWSSGTSYKAYCYPEDREELLFKAEVYESGTKLVDGYKQALLGAAMKEKMRESISSVAEEYEFLIDFKAYHDAYEIGMDVKEYNAENRTFCNIILAINTDKEADVEPDKLYPAIEKAISDVGNINGSLHLSLTESEEMEEICRIMRADPEVSTALLNACGTTFKTVITDGVIEKGVEDLQAALY